MNRVLKAIIAGSFSIQLLPALAEAASPFPDVHTKPYPEARDLVISEGWSPLDGRYADDDPVPVDYYRDTYRERGYLEVSACGGAGPFCTFWFEGPDGKIVKVITAGEEGEDSDGRKYFPIVNSIVDASPSEIAAFDRRGTEPPVQVPTQDQEIALPLGPIYDQSSNHKPVASPAQNAVSQPASAVRTRAEEINFVYGIFDFIPVTYTDQMRLDAYKLFLLLRQESRVQQDKKEFCSQFTGDMYGEYQVFYRAFEAYFAKNGRTPESLARFYSYDWEAQILNAQQNARLKMASGQAPYISDVMLQAEHYAFKVIFNDLRTIVPEDRSYHLTGMLCGAAIE